MQKTPAQRGFSMPAEWTPHERCRMAWPCRRALWDGEIENARDAIAAVARLRAAPPTAHPISIFECAIDDSWARDSGPTFVARAAAKIDDEKSGAIDGQESGEKSSAQMFLGHVRVIDSQFSSDGGEYGHAPELTLECGLFAGVVAAAAEFPGELPSLVWFRARYIALAILQTFAPETPAWDNTQAKKNRQKRRAQRVHHPRAKSRATTAATESSTRATNPPKNAAANPRLNPAARAILLFSAPLSALCRRPTATCQHFTLRC